MLLPVIKLGSQGLEVTKLGFGCMGLTSFYGGKLPDDEIVKMLESVYQNGINFFDTANVYVYFDFWKIFFFQSPIVCQEEIIGKAIEKIGRDNLVIATKTGIEIKMFPKLSVVANGNPNFVRQQCEDSLRRLGVDCLDLFYLHRIDQNIPIEVTMQEIKKLAQEGKIKYVGLSECSAKTLHRAHKIHPVSAIQVEYSLWCRGIESELLPTCKELGVGVVAYSPLGRGFFGGAHKKELDKGDFRNSQERFKIEANVKMYDELEKFAESKGYTPAQLALAWVQAQQDRVGGAGLVAIPGTTKEKNLFSNIESTRIELSQADLQAIEKIVPWEQVQGARYEEGAGVAVTWETDENPALTEEEKKKWGA